jgi:hypothetical protein
MPLARQVCSNEYKLALALAPATVSLNSQPFLLCAAAHNRNNANCGFMRTRASRRTIYPSVKGDDCVCADNQGFFLEFN